MAVVHLGHKALVDIHTHWDPPCVAPQARVLGWEGTWVPGVLGFQILDLRPCLAAGRELAFLVGIHRALAHSPETLGLQGTQGQVVSLSPEGWVVYLSPLELVDELHPWATPESYPSLGLSPWMEWVGLAVQSCVWE